MAVKVLKFPDPEDIKIRVGLEEDSLGSIEEKIDGFIS